MFGQARAHDLAERTHLILLCPRYEGVDERIRSMVDLELSIGDYVLSGGEIPALVVVDTILRLLPGAIDAESTAEESFAAGLLEYPQYTRPPVFRELGVPAVLTSGHHEAVRKWRLKESLRRTWRRRPDLLEDRPMTPRGGEAAGARSATRRASPRPTRRRQARPRRPGQARRTSRSSRAERDGRRRERRVALRQWPRRRGLCYPSPSAALAASFRCVFIAAGLRATSAMRSAARAA